MNPLTSEKGGRFQKDLSLVLDTALQAPSRRAQTTDEAVVDLVNRVRRADVELALKRSISFCYQFNKRAGISVARADVIAPLAAFMNDFIKKLPADGERAASWEMFVRFIREDLAARRMNRLQRKWMRLPSRLFRHAQELAETNESYRDRLGDLPSWSICDPDVKAGARTLPCWLKEQDQHSCWKQLCWSGCTLCFLKRREFTEKEIDGALNCDPGVRRERFCSGNRRKPATTFVDGVNGNSPKDRRGERDDDGAELEAEAAKFAEEQTSGDNLDNLVRDMFVEPRKSPAPAVSFGWRDLLPGVQYAAVALALVLAVAIAWVAFVRVQPDSVVVASLVNDGLRSGSPSAPAFLKDLPKELGASLNLNRGTVQLSTPAGDRFELTGILTNSAASGGRLWIGRPTVQGKTRGGAQVAGNALLRVRTKTLVELKKAQLSDLEWVSIELELSSGGQAGALSLVFGSQ